MDALAAADAVLRARGTAFCASQERIRLQMQFARVPYPRFFDSWVFAADNFDAAIERVRGCAPELARALVRPESPGDFTIVGNCALNLEFDADSNGATKTTIQLRTGRSVPGAKVTSTAAQIYSNGLVEIPARSGERVYFCSGTQIPEVLAAAQSARRLFLDKGGALAQGVTLRFPVARTSRLPDYSWVTGLESTCERYAVRNFVSQGEAWVDHNGFFARETQVVQMVERCPTNDYREVLIDGPFLVFFADRHGVHAAAWFDWDSFGPSPDAEARHDAGQDG